jgi:Undecaprenyl-phosphate glucose phosphotransferase
MTVHDDPIAAEMLLSDPAGDRPFAYSSAMLPGVVLVLDGVMILAAALVSWSVLPGIGADRVDSYVFCIGFVLCASVVLMNRAGLYEIDGIVRPIARADCVVIAVATAFLLFLTIAFSLKVSEDYSRLWMYSFGGGATALLLAERLAVAALAARLSRQGRLGRTLAVLGGGEQARQFLERADAVKPHFTRIAGVYALDHAGLGARFADAPVLGGPDALIEAVRQGRIDDVVVAMPWQEEARFRDVIEQLRELPVDIFISTDLIGYQMPLRPAPAHFHRLPIFEVVQKPIAGWSFVLKRAEDLVLGSLILVLIAPLLALIALAVKLDSPGPVLFRQKRFGFNNQVFSIYKFRSMYHGATPQPKPGEMEKQATRDDPRITRVGRFLRRTSLDELPQLFNVIDGSMSLVGPRPHALSHNEEYGQRIRGYFARHNVKPGITGWAQVNGLRGETERLGLMEARVRHDTYYVENWSVWFDLRILFMTGLVVLFQKNAY